MRVLSLHPTQLTSLYRGPYLLNDATVTPPAPPAPPEPAKPDPNPPPPPKPDDTEGRISELVSKNKELQTKLKAIEDAKKSEDDEKLKKKGEYETLLQQRQAELDTERKAKADYEAKLQRYEDDAKKRIEESLKGISDADKKASAQKMLDGRPLEEQITLLPEVLKLAGQTQPGFGGPTPASSSTVTKVDVDAKKAKYAELLTKRDRTPAERAEMNRLMKELQAVWDEEKKTPKAS